jgi:hypothetical protein
MKMCKHIGSTCLLISVVFFKTVFSIFANLERIGVCMSEHGFYLSHIFFVT